MKKIVLLLAALVLSLSLAAAPAEVNITFWHSMSEEAGQLMDQFVSEFNDTIGKQEGITVTSVFQGKYSDAVTKLNSILSTNQLDSLPDVMQLDATGKVPFASAPNAYTIDQAVKDHPDADLSQYLAPALSNWNLAGTQLGLPFATSTTVLFYNKTALDAAGVEAPSTLADIAALPAKLDAKDLSIYSCLPNSPLLANWLGQLGSNLVDQNNGTEGTATQLDCIDNGALLTFLKEWKALYESGALTNAEPSGDAFAAGKLLLITGSSSNVSSNLEKINGSFEMGVSFFPRINESASIGATVSGSCLSIFDQGEERRNAAWTFISFLTSADIQARFASGTGYLPANTGAAQSQTWKDLIAQYPQYDVGLQQLSQTPDSMRSVTVGPSIDFYYAIQNDVSDMLEQDMTPEETAEIMADDLNGMLTQYLRANQ